MYKVDYFSPGTLFSEVTTKDISGWNILEAEAMSKEIKERHGAVPYSFRFREVEVDDAGNKETIRSSGFFFLGGELKTIDDFPDTEENYILRTNMQDNGITHVVENNNSWKITVPFNIKTDTLLVV